MIELIQGGGVTAPKDFMAGGTYAGLKAPGEDVLDLGLLVSERPATLGATFSSNRVISPSVTASKARAQRGRGRAVVANSGCANCSVGDQGLRDAEEMSQLAARHLGIDSQDTLVCSTGMIGVELPMALIRQNLGNIKPAVDGGSRFARAIMTTDTRPKEIAVSLDIGDRKITLGGAAKGVGMIHPNMATMLAFMTTDASVEPSLLQSALSGAVDLSFNMIDVDGDESTNDTALVFANGAAGGATIEAGTDQAGAFQDALSYVCTALAKEMVRDGEGAQKLIEVVVAGGRTESEARVAARSVVSSLLVKSMVHGRDPNWGRVMMAVGKSGIEVVESKVDIFISDIHIVHEGYAFPYMKDAVVSAMGAPEVPIRIDLNLGDGLATAWGCDLTEEYVIFNSAYST